MACQAMISQSVLNLYQYILLKRAKIYHLHHCFPTAPVSVCVVFVRPHWHLFIILESGNMFLDSLAAWSTVFKGRLCSTRKSEKTSSAFTTFWLKFAITNIAPKSVYFLYRCAASTYHLCFEMSLCLLVSFSRPCLILKSLTYST